MCSPIYIPNLRRRANIPPPTEYKISHRRPINQYYRIGVIPPISAVPTRISAAKGSMRTTVLIETCLISDYIRINTYRASAHFVRISAGLAMVNRLHCPVGFNPAANTFNPHLTISPHARLLPVANSLSRCVFSSLDHFLLHASQGSQGDS